MRSQDKQPPTVRWPLYTLTGVASAACYVNALTGEFVHDDIPAVVLNKDALGSTPLVDLFANDFWGTPMADLNSHKSYRPLTILTFRTNCVLFGLNPLWFHLTNVLLHCAATMLFLRLCLNVTKLRPPFAALAAILFAVHPVHSEAVTGIVGRADVLACVFFLLSVLAYHESQGKHRLWLSILAGGLSILAKETGITVLLVNLIFDLYKTWPDIKSTLTTLRLPDATQQFAKRGAKLLASFVILVAIRLALLQGSLPRFSQQDNPAAFHPSFFVRLLTYSYLAAFNWWLLLCPSNLSHDWQMGSIPLITSIADWRNLVTGLFFGLAVVLASKCFLEFKKQGNTTMVLGLILLVLPFLPATNLVVTVGFVIAERVLYIPSMGFILLVVNGVQTIWTKYARHRQSVVSLLILILMAQSLRCLIRNRDWRSRESLLRAGILTLPHNAKMHYNFGNFLRDSSQTELAKVHYNTAIRLWPTYASAHNNLGTLLTNHRAAEDHFLAAIRFSKDHLNAHYNLGQLYRKLNRTTESEQMLRRCMQIASNFVPAYLELARLKGTNDRGVGALLKRVVELHPSDPHHVAMYAQWLNKNGNARLAMKYYATALAEHPLNAEAIMGATRILRRRGAHSRLFQLITRYHHVHGAHASRKSIHLHIYLHGWHLKHEMRNHSKGYVSESNMAASNMAVNRYTTDSIKIS